jgi:hypothetical protein
MTQTGILYNGDRRDKINHAGISAFEKRKTLQAIVAMRLAK